MTGKRAVLTDWVAAARSVLIEDEIARRGIQLRRSGSERIGPCPRCGGRDRFAFSVTKQIWNCRGCKTADVTGDVIGLVEWLDGVGFLDACTTLAGEERSQHQHVHSGNNNSRADDTQAGIKAARHLWNAAINPIGTLGEIYLVDERKLKLPPELAESVLRYYGSCLWRDGADAILVPALIAAFRAIDNDSITGIHRIALRNDGRKLDRRMLGVVAGSAIKLDPAGDTLHLAEGLESAMAARQLGHVPTWAAGCAAAIADFPIIDVVRELVLLGETGAAFAEAAEACTTRWHQAGKRVRVLMPRDGRSDFNDELKRMGTPHAA